jgi:hypothetical protein
MSTTPTTPERGGVSYTVVGGARQDRILAAPYRASLLLLNRGARFDREQALREAEALDIGEVISVEHASVEVDSLSRDHPGVRFLLAPEGPSVGELIDIGIAEARSRLVLVLWSDMRLESPEALPAELEAAERCGAVCVTPELSGADGSIIPSAASPRLQGARLTVGRAVPSGERIRTLYPFDYCGIFRKDRFQSLGGFDSRITSPYWQRLQFGLLAHLWGESLVLRRGLRASYRAAMAPEDTTPDPAYRRFYLRAVAVRLGEEGAYLPMARFLPFVFRSGAPLGTALSEFREARRWVAEHRKQFRLDLKGLIGSWDTPA